MFEPVAESLIRQGTLVCFSSLLLAIQFSRSKQLPTGTSKAGCVEQVEDSTRFSFGVKAFFRFSVCWLVLVGRCYLRFCGPGCGGEVRAPVWRKCSHLCLMRLIVSANCGSGGTRASSLDASAQRPVAARVEAK